MTARLMAGNPLPSPQRMLDMPAEGTASMDAADMTKALSMATLADPAKVRLGFLPEYVTVDGADGGIEAGDAVSAAYDGAPATVRINPGFVSDAVTAVNDERVAIAVCAGGMIVRVTSPREGEVTYSHVIQGLQEPLVA